MEGRFVRVEVFTDTPGHGNPAGVVLAAQPIPDDLQRRWAAAVRLPGNGFLWPATAGTYHARFQAPDQEVSLSGHTALSCAHAALTGPAAGARRVRLRSRTADLEIEREGELLWITLPRPVLQPYDAPLDRIAHALNMAPEGFGVPSKVARTGDGDLLLPVGSFIDLFGLQPDFTALAAIANELGTRGFCVFSMHTSDPSSTVASRFFAPQIGLDEDIATGSVHGPLAAHLWHIGHVMAHSPTLRIVGEQGAALGRPCRIQVELTIDDGALIRTRVGGQVITIEDRPLAPGELA